MTKRSVFGIAVAILMAALASPAQAVVIAETVEFEAFLGLYAPEPGIVLDDAVTAGIRVGYNITKSFNVTGQLGFASTDGEQETDRWGTAGVDTDLILTDFSFMWNIFPDRKFVATLYGGPGYAFASAEIDSPSGPDPRDRFDNLDELDEDSFTFHAGFGFKWDMTGRFYLSFASRARWFESHTEDGSDREVTFGAGWKFGG